MTDGKRGNLVGVEFRKRDDVSWLAFVCMLQLTCSTTGHEVHQALMGHP